MTNLLIINLDRIVQRFEDIRLFNIIYLIAMTEEKDGWGFSTTEDLEYDLLNDFDLDVDDEACIGILDFKTNELSKINVKVVIEQELVDKKKIEISKS